MTRVYVGVVVGGLLTACTPKTDLNVPCTLKRANADGGDPIALTEGAVQAAQGKNKDFIMTGSTECDDHFCVRDSTMEPELSDAGLNADAQGYCSRHCRLSEVCPSYAGKLDENSATRLTCRALLLDTEVLASVQLPGVTDPYFCARGSPDTGAADGG